MSMNIKLLFRITTLFVLLSFPLSSVRAQEGDFSLSGLVRGSFESYYNRTNFSDKRHVNGWFRVDDFLNWVERNDAELENLFIKNYTNKFTSYPPKSQEDLVILGGFLGSYYTASHCTALKNIYPVIVEVGLNSSAGTSSMAIAGMDGNFITFIESGIHEGAHMLPYLCAGRKAANPSDNLSELISISAELTYGLPLLGQDSSTSPDIRRALNIQEGGENLFAYAQRLLVLLQYDAISPLWEQQQAQRLFPYKLEKSSFSLEELLTDLIDLQANNLTLNQKPLSLRQYLQLINVLPQKQDQVAAWLEEFMGELNQYARLPKSRQKREWNAFSNRYEKYLDKNKELIKQLLLRHTASLRVAPLPEGYL